MSHAGTSHANAASVPATRSINDGAIHSTTAAVDSQLPLPQNRLPGMARRWNASKATPAYRAGVRLLSGARRNPPNRAIQPMPNQRSPKSRTSKLETRNRAKAAAASLARPSNTPLAKTAQISTTSETPMAETINKTGTGQKLPVGNSALFCIQRYERESRIERPIPEYAGPECYIGRLGNV